MLTLILNLVLLVGLVALAATSVIARIRRSRRRHKQENALLNLLASDMPVPKSSGPVATGNTPAAGTPTSHPEQLAELLQLLEARRERGGAILGALSPRRAWEAGSRMGERLAQRPGAGL